MDCLLYYGANPNLLIEDLELDHNDPITTLSGLPLQEAIQYGTMQQIHMLLRHGAKPNLANGIHTAIRSDEHEVEKIKLLIAYGADKNLNEWAGNPIMTSLLQAQGVTLAPPFILAYSLNKPRVVSFLFDTNVDLALLASRGEVLPGIRRERKPHQKARRVSDSKMAMRSNAKRPGALSPKKGVLKQPMHVAKTKRGVRMHARAPADLV